MRHYCVSTQHSDSIAVHEFIRQHSLHHEIHLTRTRFWVPQGRLTTELELRFSHCVEQVDESRDLATGFPRDTNLQL
jgi:hypothetical protein